MISFLLKTSLLITQIVQAVPVRSILEQDTYISEEIIKQLLVRHDLNHLLKREIDDLVDSIARDFPEVVKLSTIGYTVEQRPITLITIDARDYLIQNDKFVVPGKRDPYS